MYDDGIFEKDRLYYVDSDKFISTSHGRKKFSNNNSLIHIKAGIHVLLKLDYPASEHHGKIFPLFLEDDDMQDAFFTWRYILVGSSVRYML